MMNKLKSAKVNLLRFLFVLPLLAVVLVSFRKEIGDTLKGISDQEINAPIVIKDTVPITSAVTDKNFHIFIMKNDNDPLIIIKDKNKKEITRLLMSEWNERQKYFDDLYGKLPPPPPPPLPPSPPAAIAPVSDLIEKMNVNAETKYVEIWLKDGRKESYNLKDKSEKVLFEKKYGKLPPPPPPVPQAPAVPNEQLNGVVSTLNGNVEKVDASLEGPAKPSTIEAATISVKGNQPLVVLDGEIVKYEKLAQLNAETIESIDVLKDRPATSLYGEKGKDGVLIIKTKSKVSKESNPLIVLDGKIITKGEMDNLSPHTIESVNVLKGKTATDLYPEKGKDGVIVITSVKKK